MNRGTISSISHLFKLTDEEAVTLRRVAFGRSDLRALRRVDIERLLQLRMITEARGNMALTISGKEHLESLPRAVFAKSPAQRHEG